jgi:transglutaminase-like putative cysteine protease
MDFRLTWLAGVALLGLVILRLTRLFLPTETGLPWQMVAIIAAALGFIITWAAYKARFGAVATLLTHALVFAVFSYLYVGGDIAGTTIPPLSILGDIAGEVADALTIFRYSAPPVTPLAGIVAMAAMMVWALAGVAAWGLLNNAPYLSIVPPVVFYLQLAVIDRQSTGLLWTSGLLVLVGAGLASIAGDQRSGGGYAGYGGPVSRARALALPVGLIVAVTAVAVFATRQAVNAEAVPATGLLDWRNRSGIGSGFGSVSYNPFIDVQRNLVSNSDTPVFLASVNGEVPSGGLYWRLLTMDSFNGDWWYASESKLEDLDETGWEADDYEFRGNSVPINTDVVILNLQSAWLPAAYSPVGLVSTDRVIANTTRISPVDGSLHIDGVTGRNMAYRIQSLVPDVDTRVLATGDAGDALSPLFEAAAREGRFPPVPTPADTARRPRDLDRYLDLPRGLDPTGELTRLAESLTVGLETDYEKALALEHYFRDPAQFSYSINVAPNERDSGLIDWLLNPESPGYHTGYCEQFSASMGVLARLLDIPTRTVLGFTPGEVRSDGSILVRDRNAHAWVEVWLPAQGWVRFDPTPRGDGVNPTTFERTGLTAGDLSRYFAEIEEAALAAAQGGGTGGSTPFRELTPGEERFAGSGGGSESGTGGLALPDWLTPVAVWALVGALILGTVPAVKLRRRRRRLRRLEEGDIGAAWAEIVDRLIDSGIGLDPADTPVEVARANVADLYPLATVYVESVYGPTGEVGPEARAAAVESLTATEDRLRSRESRWQRIRRTYRVRSLLPDWIKRVRRR